MRRTTNFNIPYPEENDSPREYPTAVAKPAADIIDAALAVSSTDSGWVPVTTGSLFANNAVWVRKIGQAVYLRGNFKLASGAQLSNITYGTAATIPAGYRPKFDVHKAIAARNPAATNGAIRPQANLEILPTGQLNLHIHSTGLDVALPGYVSWIVG